MSPDTQAPAPRLNSRLMPRGAGGGMGIPEKLGPKGLSGGSEKGGGAGRLGRRSKLRGNKLKVRAAQGSGAHAILPTAGE